jgi:signal transduction histidine kinase
MIPETRLQDIFNPFRQLDPGRAKADEASSLGLGLFIVQAIVTAHQGTIDVASTERGTTFTMRLPRSVSPACPTSAAVPAAMRA